MKKWECRCHYCVGDSKEEILNKKYKDYKDWEEEDLGTPVCKTCGKPYKKPKKGEYNFCSSAFHCCRDCKWELTPCEAFCARKLVEWCDGCKKAFPDGYQDWLKWQE